MAVQQTDVRVEGPPPALPPGPMHEPGLGELFRQLSDDATRLIRQEVALAKAEIRETGRALSQDVRRIAVAAVLGLLGGMAATAFLIIALGGLLGNYWLSALIVTVLLLAVAAMLAKGAVDDIKSRDLKPTQTLETLRADAEWAKREAEVVKQEWKS